MEAFEEKLAQATTPATRTILGAIGAVWNNAGETLYHHAAGSQSLNADSPPIDPDSVVSLGSAGKFITHIAALQLVDRGILTLDEPLEKHLPELAELPLILPPPPNNEKGEEFILRPPTKKVTLRHLLTHTSGFPPEGHPLIDAYLASGHAKDTNGEPKKRFYAAVPLIFEPGEGYAYGQSIHWTQRVVGRLSSEVGFLGYIQANIFDPLEMTSSSYLPQDSPDLWDRRLRMVERSPEGEGEKKKDLIPADDAAQGLACSISDMRKILVELISPTNNPSSKLLKNPELVDVLFQAQFRPGSQPLRDLRSDPENYAFIAGPPPSSPEDQEDGGHPGVNWSAIGLVAVGEGLITGLPVGTVAWEGMPNVMWAVNRERGIAALFATQLIPFADPEAHAVAVAFMRGVWGVFA